MIQLLPYDLERSFEVYLSLIHEAFEASGRLDHDFETFALGCRARLTDWLRRDDAFLRELRVDGRTVGLVEAVVNKQCQPQISTLVVTKSFRRRGLALKLEQAALDFFRHRGIATIVLNVAASNTGALAFYLRSNWKEIGAGPYPGSIRLQKSASF